MVGRVPGIFCTVLVVLALAACAAPRPAPQAGPAAPGRTAAQGAAQPAPDWTYLPDTAPVATSSGPVPAAQIVSAGQPQQCVPYARRISGIGIRGDAWTWWRRAAGHYARGRTPRVGAVLVLSKSSRLRRGHLAVVTRILNSREVLVDQANWLNGGRIHLNTPVRDVSTHNDWSLVRVWYTPGRSYGVRRYPAEGFVYQQRVATATP